VRIQYLVLWLEDETQITPINEGYKMDFFPEQTNLCVAGRCVVGLLYRGPRRWAIQFLTSLLDYLLDVFYFYKKIKSSNLTNRNTEAVEVAQNSLCLFFSSFITRQIFCFSNNKEKNFDCWAGSHGPSNMWPNKRLRATPTDFIFSVI
jgi:hypothetical protein